MTAALALAVLALTAACACWPARQVDERAFWRQRDYWLLILAGIGGLAAGLAGEWWLTTIALWFLCRWRSNVPLASLVVWAGIAATWALTLAAARTPWFRPALAGVLTVIAVGQTGYAVWQWYAARGRPLVQAPRGTFGQRTLLAAFLALVLPLSGYGWPVIAAGLVLTSSWVAWAAALAGLLVWHPLIGLEVVGAALTVGGMLWLAGHWRTPLDHWTLRGSSLDSLYQRARTWRLILRMWPTSWERVAFGAGPSTLQYDLLRWDHRFNADLITGYAHSEPLHVLYEYGLCGVAAIALFAWRVGAGLTLGDPWSAAAVAGAVAACGTITCRTPSTGVPWLVVCAVVAARSGA